MSEMLRKDYCRLERAERGPERAEDLPTPPEPEVAGFERALRQGAEADPRPAGKRPGPGEDGGDRKETFDASLSSLFRERFGGGSGGAGAPAKTVLGSFERSNRAGISGRDDCPPVERERRVRRKAERGEEGGGDPAAGRADENPLLASPESSAGPVAPVGSDLPDLNEVVQRILVSRPESGGGEIRLSLNEALLPDAEIRLSLDSDGVLSVVLVAGSAATLQTLGVARGDLQERLEGHGREVRISVTSGAETRDNDANRRSAGYRGYFGPGDEEEGQRRV